jgi:hypothetical protein
MRERRQLCGALFDVFFYQTSGRETIVIILLLKLSLMIPWNDKVIFYCL